MKLKEEGDVGRYTSRATVLVLSIWMMALVGRFLGKNLAKLGKTPHCTL